VEMSVVVALIAAAALTAPPTLDLHHLPRLPPRGLVRQQQSNVVLETMHGRPIGVLKGFSLAQDKATSHGLVLRERQGRLYGLDVFERRVRQVFERPERVPGCRLTDARVRLELLVCGRTIKTARYVSGQPRPSLRVVARAPGRVGHWQRAEFAPQGDAFFAQWIAECEVPVAFLVTGGAMHPYGGTTMRDAPVSVALGWLPNGRAVIHFPNGACGGSFDTPGIYAVPGTGKPALLLRTKRFASYWMWGG
jgi:hypothetical protein